MDQFLMQIQDVTEKPSKTQQHQQGKKRQRRKPCLVAPRDFSSFFTEGSMFFRIGDMEKALGCFNKWPSFKKQWPT
ncbi:unnamed protein product [Orchesella dallaii]|uniref:Uncharacterized protein n=1 Tax=Orchesella dallaii TaxID=48710 RepID=A0ABP1R065_9HEXA